MRRLSRRPLMFFCMALFALSCVQGPVAPAFAQDSGEIKKKLEDKRQSAAQRKADLDKLAKKERGLSKELEGLEREALTLSGHIETQERDIRQIEREERRLSNEYAQLDAKRRKSAERLTGILKALWPAHLQNLENKTAGLESWEEADRRFAWLTAFYGAAGDAYQDYKDKSGELAANMAAQDAARNRLLEQRRKVNADKDELLAKRLAQMRELRNLRRQRVNAEEELKDILGVIGKLNYQLETLDGGDLSRMKGRLSWPARGRVASGFDPGGGSGKRGVGLSLAAGTKVAAVATGKVVHAEKLRGMGDVAIVSHGGDYYTVYAYLTDLAVKAGDNVTAGQTLGTAGYYPVAGGPGMYFELRFREKAINPVEWLSKQS